jgi:hypothetical protein
LDITSRTKGLKSETGDTFHCQNVEKIHFLGGRRNCDFSSTNIIFSGFHGVAISQIPAASASLRESGAASLL